MISMNNLTILRGWWDNQDLFQFERGWFKIFFRKNILTSKGLKKYDGRHTGRNP